MQLLQYVRQIVFLGKGGKHAPQCTITTASGTRYSAMHFHIATPVRHLAHTLQVFV